VRKKVLVIDDETYITQDPSQLPSISFIHARNHSQLEVHHKFKKVTKFPRKFFILLAIDEFGNVSDPLTHIGNMQSDVYHERCLRQPLIPFIPRHYEIEDVLFWPCLATINYAKIATEGTLQQILILYQKWKTHQMYHRQVGSRNFGLDIATEAWRLKIFVGLSKSGKESHQKPWKTMENPLWALPGKIFY